MNDQKPEKVGGYISPQDQYDRCLFSSAAPRSFVAMNGVEALCRGEQHFFERLRWTEADERSPSLEETCPVRSIRNELPRDKRTANRLAYANDVSEISFRLESEVDSRRSFLPGNNASYSLYAPDVSELAGPSHNVPATEVYHDDHRSCLTLSSLSSRA